MERLKELKGDIYRCIHCKACQFAYSGEPSRKGPGPYKARTDGKIILYEGMLKSCPAGIEFGWEAYNNSGKVWIARAVLEGEISLDENVRDVAETCITCGMCGAQCENQIRTVDIIEALRAAVLEAGVPPLDKHALVEKIAKKENNPYGGKKEDRMAWVKESGIDESIIDNKNAKVAYFVGCTASYRQKNIAGATVKLLKKLGYNITVLNDEVCCGSPFFRVGLVDIAKEFMNRNLELFSKFDEILFSCAGCYRTFTIDYPKWTGKPNPFKTHHAMELVSKLVSDGKIVFKDNPELKDKVVTYHDPCHTGRHFGLWIKENIIEESKNLFLDMRKVGKAQEEWFEIPRTIIKALPGVKFNEMYRIKMNSFCCGAGGGVRAQFPEFSIKTASRRLDEAEAVGADIVLTECPFCWRNLSDANEQYQHGLKVFGILELIDSFDLIKEVKK
ncbi:MAG: (Fe-S)-binding protein [Promethearchaeota archaeon]